MGSYWINRYLCLTPIKSTEFSLVYDILILSKNPWECIHNSGVSFLSKTSAQKTNSENVWRGHETISLLKIVESCCLKIVVLVTSFQTFILRTTFYSSDFDLIHMGTFFNVSYSHLLTSICWSNATLSPSLWFWWKCLGVQIYLNHFSFTILVLTPCFHVAYINMNTY